MLKCAYTFQLPPYLRFKPPFHQKQPTMGPKTSLAEGFGRGLGQVKKNWLRMILAAGRKVAKVLGKVCEKKHNASYKVIIGHIIARSEAVLSKAPMFTVAFTILFYPSLMPCDRMK